MGGGMVTGGREEMGGGAVTGGREEMGGGAVTEGREEMGGGAVTGGREEMGGGVVTGGGEMMVMGAEAIIEGAVIAGVKVGGAVIPEGPVTVEEAMVACLLPLLLIKSDVLILKREGERVEEREGRKRAETNIASP